MAPEKHWNYVYIIQRQATPNCIKGDSSPRPKSVSPVEAHRPGAWSSPDPSRDSNATTDDDEHEEHQVRYSGLRAETESPVNEYRATLQAESPLRSKPSLAGPKKLGLVGGMHRKPNLSKDNDSIKSTSPAGNQYAGSEADTAGRSRSSIERDSNYSNSPMRAKSKLGFIGGRNKGTQARDQLAGIGEEKPALPRERLVETAHA